MVGGGVVVVVVVGQVWVIFVWIVLLFCEFGEKAGGRWRGLDIW